MSERGMNRGKQNKREGCVLLRNAACELPQQMVCVCGCVGVYLCMCICIWNTKGPGSRGWVACRGASHKTPCQSRSFTACLTQQLDRLFAAVTHWSQHPFHCRPAPGSWSPTCTSEVSLFSSSVDASEIDQISCVLLNLKNIWLNICDITGNYLVAPLSSHMSIAGAFHINAGRWTSWFNFWWSSLTACTVSLKSSMVFKYKTSRPLSRHAPLNPSHLVLVNRPGTWRHYGPSIKLLRWWSPFRLLLEH